MALLLQVCKFSTTNSTDQPDGSVARPDDGTKFTTNDDVVDITVDFPLDENDEPSVTLGKVQLDDEPDNVDSFTVIITKPD